MCIFQILFATKRNDICTGGRVLLASDFRVKMLTNREDTGEGTNRQVYIVKINGYALLTVVPINVCRWL